MKQDFFSTTKLPPYIFEAINQAKVEAVANGKEIIDFGMGNPDMAPPQEARELLSKLAVDPSLYGYSAVGGIEELKKAHCQYYQRRFNVELDHKSESLVTIGAKEGLTTLATALSGNDDDYIVIADPSYPIHSFAFKIAKINVEKIKTDNHIDFLAKFKEFVAKATKKPTAVVVNYPSNPTGEPVSIEFYQELVDFCRQNEIYIISDIAYCELYFDKDAKPNSILEVAGAKDIAIEFSTVSKTFCLAGARVGFAAGNKDLINALHKMKSYLDYGSFTPLQKIAAFCLSDGCEEYLQQNRDEYKTRADYMVEELASQLNWQVPTPRTSMFIWCQLPEKFKNMSSFDFCNFLIKETGVAFSPGSGFGENGEGYIRISLIHDKKNIDLAISRMKEVF